MRPTGISGIVSYDLSVSAAVRAESLAVQRRSVLLRNILDHGPRLPKSLLNKAQICMITFVKLQVSDLNLDHERGYSAAS